MKRLMAIAACAAFGAFGATAASAITVGGTATGTFTGEDAGSPSCGIFGCFGTDEAEVNGSGKVLTWPAESCFIGCGDDPDLQSSLTINDGAFSKNLPAGTGSVDLFSLTWFNASTPALTTPDNFNAFATFTVAFTQPGGGGGSEDVTFNITNTDNPLGDTIAAALSVGPLDFGGVPVDLGSGVKVVGYSLSQSGSGGYGNADCGATGIWCNPEGGTSVLTISANVEVVPLPAAAWMLLAGVGGLAAVARRKKAS